MLELKNLCAGYGGVEILHNLTYTFDNNKNYCLLGPNGCGKTTLVKAMAALIDFSGEVLIDGVSVKEMKRREIASKVAVLSQVSTVYFPYSVYDTVMLGRYQHMKGSLFGGPKEEDRNKVEECLRTVNLLDVKDRQIDELSGGQRQRVFLAHALAQNPEIILLDEPTNHLDIKHQLELMDYLIKWTSEGNHSVIGVMHDINLALKLTDNVIFMKEGFFVSSGSFDSIADATMLKEIYDTDIVEFMKESYGKWRDK